MENPWIIVSLISIAANIINIFVKKRLKKEIENWKKVSDIQENIISNLEKQVEDYKNIQATQVVSKTKSTRKKTDENNSK